MLLPRYFIKQQSAVQRFYHFYHVCKPVPFQWADANA